MLHSKSNCWLALGTILAGLGAAGTASAAENSVLLRYTAALDGVDETFPVRQGTTSADNRTKQIVFDSRGRIVTCGYVVANGKRQLLVARRNPDGTPDNGFGWQGLTTLPVAIESRPASCAIAAGDKVVVALSTDDSTSWWLVKFNADGSIDGSFGIGGFSATSASGCWEFAPVDIKIAPDQKLVVAGTCWHTPLSSDFVVARYSATGVLDTTFGGGVVSFDFDPAVGLTLGNLDRCRSLVLHKGFVILAGDTAPSPKGMVMARITSTGALDKKEFVSFGPDLSEAANSVAVDSRDRIVLAGTVYASSRTPVPSAFAVARLNWAGGLDTTFSGDGLQTWAVFWPESGFASGAAVKIGSGDKIVVAGKLFLNDLDRLTVVRFLSNGEVEKGFITRRFGPQKSGSDALVLDSSDRPLVAGFTATP